MFEMIAFDADDTLWHTEQLYVDVQAQFKALLDHYINTDALMEKFYAVEMRNLDYFGYGVKGFVLSMVETAIELTDGRVTGTDIQRLIDLGKQMLRAEVELLPEAEAAVLALAQTHPLMIITKGDLFDQESKVARSGLGPNFRHVEIVSAKTPAAYAALLARHGLTPERFLMVGNSLKSDVLPVAELGATAVYVPYALTWEHERVSGADASRFHEIAHLGELPALVARLENGDG
jgi:putative hydrolase of the HAD superfamily